MLYTDEVEVIDFIKIPLLISTYHAGTGNIYQDGMDYEDVPEECVNGVSEPYAIYVSGDSMEPELRDKDKIIIDTNATARNNSIVAVYYNGKYLIKRLKQVHFSTYLHSDNAKYQPIKIRETDDIQILGVAVHVYRKL